MNSKDLIKNAFVHAWDTFFDSWVTWIKYSLFAFLAVVGLIFSTLGIITLSQSFSENMQAATFLVGAFVILYFLIALYYVVLQNMFDFYDKKPQRGFSDYPIAPRVLLVSFMYWMIIFLGFAALIVPGIIFAARFGFAPYVALDTELGVVASLKKSWNMTRGYTGHLVLLYFISKTVASVTPLNFIVVPFFIMVNIYVYRHLAQEKSV